MKPINYLILLALPATVIAGYYLGGWFNFLVPVCCFFAYPVANLFLSSSEKHAHNAQSFSSSAYKAVALIFVPVLSVLTAWCVYIVYTSGLNIVEFTGLVVSLGVVNSVIGFTLAHEFIHHFNKAEKAAGYFLLLQNNYMHYGIEHVYGHHVYACTPVDPHTAHAGESIYAFLPRAIFKTYTNAVVIERKRLLRSNTKKQFLHNRIVWFAVMQVALMLAILFLLNIYALLFFVLQNMVAIILLHIINYLQHYGLMREINTAGKYEKINMHHAWNTGKKNTSLNLFQLENHADHHVHPHKNFNELKHTENSPQHPAGYSFMVLLALVPPLWFKIMNKRISTYTSNTPT
ncbi:MAG: alkane 1-monooxygenase [Parafilimonas sp.]